MLFVTRLYLQDISIAPFLKPLRIFLKKHGDIKKSVTLITDFNYVKGGIHFTHLMLCMDCSLHANRKTTYPFHSPNVMLDYSLHANRKTTYPFHSPNVMLDEWTVMVRIQLVALTTLAHCKSLTSGLRQSKPVLIICSVFDGQMALFVQNARGRKAWQMGSGLIRCIECHNDVSVISGTIFHGTGNLSNCGFRLYGM